MQASLSLLNFLHEKQWNMDSLEPSEFIDVDNT